tara:strand:- start:50 stop:238 length:189 start_codon:yes stop_codon:yes gene_type:complete
MEPLPLYPKLSNTVFISEKLSWQLAMNPKGSRGAPSFFSQPTSASSLDEGDCKLLRSGERLR